jgi:flavin-dependent dehydrogenase
MSLVAEDGKSVPLPLEWLGADSTFAIGLSRARLDSILLDRARELGAEVREGTRVSSHLETVGGGYRLDSMNSRGDRFTPSARLVINAAGRGSAFGASKTGVPKEFLRDTASKRRRLFGCKVHLGGVNTGSETDGLYFFEGGYGGLASIEGGRVNLCMLIDEKLLSEAGRDRDELLDLTMRRNARAREILSTAVTDGEWLSTGPVTFRRQSPPAAAAGVISVGDANAFIDPFTGSGILLALDSAELAATIINRAFDEGLRDPKTLEVECARALKASYSRRFRVSSILRRMATDERGRGIMRAALAHIPGLGRAIARNTR